uniref:PH domain-containing protein n=1 Tax=Romanomermis culicivorax TaxID=13658 RepID=A0A915IJC1_ROMCU
MQNLQNVLEELVAAQSQVTTAVGKLGNLLSSYQVQNFPLESNATEFPTVVEKFHGTINELSSWMEIVSQQLNNCALYPVAKFQRDMNDLLGRKDVFHSISDELDQAILKHTKLSKKDSSKKLDEINDELKTHRKRFHLAGLHYYENLNKLQFTRRIALLEPILSVIYAFRSFCHVGHQSLTQDKESFEFFTRTQEQLQSLHNEQEFERKKYEELIRTVNEVERLNPDVYKIEQATEIPECQNNSDSKEQDTTTCLDKQGYLFMKNKSGLLHRWDRVYFHVTNGNLMGQSRDEIVSKVIMELSPCVKATLNDGNEDRRYTFAVNCYKTKKSLILQASSAQDRRQWIETINAAAATTNFLENLTQPAENLPKIDVHKSATSSISDLTDEPIQFDLLTSNLKVEEQNFPKKFDDETKFEYFLAIKFLGSLDISDDRDDRLIKMAVQKILETRKDFNITKFVDVTMIIEKQEPVGNQESNTSRMAHLLLVDKSTNEIKAAFRLDDLASWNPTDNHVDTVSLVVRTKSDKSDGRHRFTCYLLQTEEPTKAIEICQNLTKSSRQVFQSLIQKNVVGKSTENESKQVEQSTSKNGGISAESDPKTQQE